MRPMPRSPSQRAALALALLGLFFMGFVPLFGGPGYEAALGAGLILPGLAAVATALDVRASAGTAFDGFRRGIASGALLGAAGFGVTCLHGVRVGFCDALEGAELYALGPAAGALLGGVWGAIAGRITRTRALAVALSLAGPLAGIAVSVVRFYTSPMVFAFDPFFGFFSGTLYDSVITGLGRLATYRLGSLATLIAVGAAAFAAERPLARTLARGLAALAAVISLAHVVRGPSLGHYQLTLTLREALGKSLTVGRCELVYPRGTPEVEARALAHECDGHVKQLERLFGARGPERITAFVFASAEQKGYLMGAAGTYIAKPWRREIYLQRAGYPHPVMRHELAHVVAGAFGVGPFRVAGPLGGLVPDPGRIEGVAVAASAHDEELSLGEWAKAMKELGLLPPLERVFKLSFLGEPSSRAYVVGGAFIEWLGHERGMEAVRRWYGGAPLEAAAGASLGALETAWRASLDRWTVGPDVLEVARARFDQPAIFGRRCPHVVDRIEGEAGVLLGQLDTERARKLYRDVLGLDPHDVGARLGLATCAEREGKGRDAKALLGAVAEDRSLGKAVRARAKETLGDLALTEKAGDEARRLYQEVADLVVDTDRLRTLDVKRFAAGGGGAGAIEEYLLGDPVLGRNPSSVAARLSAWAGRDPKQGLADYLLARIYLGDGRYDLAGPSLDRALEKELSIPRVLREAVRLRVVVACALEDPRTALLAALRWTTLDGPRPAERAAMADLLERCTGERPGEHPPPRAERPVQAACPDPMAEIPAAETFIGSPRGQGVDDEWPRYRTKLAAYCLDRTEVTVLAYAACVDTGACQAAGSYHVTCTAKGHGENYPINCVDWAQAAAYCTWKGERLPTEAEWEHAASGGDLRTYSWGNEPPDDRTCWKASGACPVGRYAAGAFGLFDMTGNVWEWTSDAYGDYPFPPVESPSKVYRGGSWSRRFEKWMRVRLRNRAAPSFEGSHLGFRCARDRPGAECPFGRGDDGHCLHGVVDAECRDERKWNGERCAAPGATGCGEGHHFVPGHGCQFDAKIEDAKPPPLDLGAVKRVRSPEFDGDCGAFQAKRPAAYRFEGGSHEARNAVERSLGCKNRDVGVGWNSGCCP